MGQFRRGVRARGSPPPAQSVIAVMQYQFLPERQNYGCYASGKVFYSYPGLSAFPVRLASEIFLFCQSLLDRQRALTLYDPCCGSACCLTALGFLHHESIGRIIASDVSDDALAIARRNLSLLSLPGMDRRMEEIRASIDKFDKPSHREALRCAVELWQRLADASTPIDTKVFSANVTNPSEMQKHLAGTEIDLVIADIPYGRLSEWNDIYSVEKPVEAMLAALASILGVEPSSPWHHQKAKRFRAAVSTASNNSRPG